jgi:hypothetical protein
MAWDMYTKRKLMSLYIDPHTVNIILVSAYKLNILRFYIENTRKRLLVGKFWNTIYGPV